MGHYFRLNSMELDPSVVGGVVAGLVGLSLGIGAMVFTEQQQERRFERQVVIFWYIACIILA